MITKDFSENRSKLLQLMEPHSIAIIFAAPEVTRNKDVTYPYRQDSDFYYLTGFTEPDAVAVLAPDLDAKYTLFCKQRDPDRECWIGSISGPEGAIKTHGADAAFAIEELDAQILPMLEQVHKVYYPIGYNSKLDQKIPEWLNQSRLKTRSGGKVPTEFAALDHYIHELRLIKSMSEIAKIQQAVSISAHAHMHLMRMCKPDMPEHRLEAEFEYHCAMAGARFQAYSPIIGGGTNGCTLHYTSNHAKLKAGDLVLIDAGCECDYYASDITRTFPVNGKFTDPQRALYELVLEAQLAALNQVRPGNTWEDINNSAIEIITRGLIKLKIIQGSIHELDKWITDKAYKPFYMHTAGHWLGMDVHDVGNYKVANHWRPLEPGMCLTIEPGIYIAPGISGVDPKWHGIGIRIEDDVVVTTTGSKVLSSAVPKDIGAIEALMAG